MSTNQCVVCVTSHAAVHKPMPTTPNSIVVCKTSKTLLNSKSTFFYSKILSYSDTARPERHAALSSGALRFHTPLSLSVRRRRVFERTIARAILTRTKLTTSKYSLFHFTASKAARRRGAVFAFFPGSPSTEYTIGQKSRCLSSQ